MNETTTVAAIALGVYLSTIGIFLTYPCEYDSRRKREFVRRVLFFNAGIALSAGTALTLWTVTTGTAFKLPSEAIPYLWAGTLVLAGQLLFIHCPIAYIFQQINEAEGNALNHIIRLSGDLLYIDDIDLPVRNIESTLAKDRQLLTDVGLYDLASLIVERARSASMRPVDLAKLLMERATLAASLARLRPITPFRGLNEMLSAAGAGVIVALSVQLALTGGS